VANCEPAAVTSIARPLAKARSFGSELRDCVECGGHRPNETELSRAADNERKEQEQYCNYETMWSKWRAESASAIG